MFLASSNNCVDIISCEMGFTVFLKIIYIRGKQFGYSRTTIFFYGYLRPIWVKTMLNIRQKVRNDAIRVEFLCLNSKESIRCIYLTTKIGVRQHPVPKNNMIFNFPSFI
jgi:hypothetical protein